MRTLKKTENMCEMRGVRWREVRKSAQWWKERMIALRRTVNRCEMTGVRR